ncbi:hypothetical protein MMC11_008134 [Xylographa trunciseda]|nr:hypothetical protein [Xylographa trunciseda]
MSTAHSPLWEKALERYRKELKDGDDYDHIMDVGSMEELLDQARALEPTGSRTKTPLQSLNRLEPILAHLNDFSAIIAICLGANTKSAALVWGSIRIILTLLVPAGGDMLRDVLNMLEELSLSLPRFRAYENTLPMNEAFESALLAVYTEMTCFCARTINFFRNNPHNVLQRKSWSDFDGDFQQTMRRLRRLSQTVDSEADAARMRADGERNAEILAVMHALQLSKSNHEVIPCYCIPLGVTDRFYGRDSEVQYVQKVLDPTVGRSGIQSIALYGMGGVGKTQIALHYANSCRETFDAILWISADNTMKLAQSFLEVAQRLDLVPENQEAQDSAAAITKVKAWLGQTSTFHYLSCKGEMLTQLECRWLLIMDNADDLTILKHAWPSSGHGSILLTSRDFSSSFSPASEGLHVKPFDDTAGASVLLTLCNQEAAIASVHSTAKDIAHIMGGLPLALNQIGGFIVQQRLALKDFLPLYERNSAKIHAKKSHLSDYDHSLSTVWEIALEQLSGDAGNLQKLLAFLDPDRIHESILTSNTAEGEDEQFAFLHDEMDFLDAKEILLRGALIERFDDATISIHRLIQSAVLTRLSTEEKTKFSSYAVKLLLQGFPNTWETDVGHQFSAWKLCEMCLPHVNFLVSQVRKWKLMLVDPQSFADLVLRCCWYLYERENYYQALDMIQVALDSFTNKNSLAYASAIDLHGLLELDITKTFSALGKFEVALNIREKILGADDAFIASSLNNLGLAYTEIGDMTKAFNYHQKAIDLRLQAQSNRIGNSYSNMSSTLLRMGKPDEAEEMLARCPSLKDFNDETFLSTGNPRFSGDMVLLARIRLQQNRLDDAIRLSSKALTFRQSMLGNRLKTCDSLYLVADLLQRRGNMASAKSLLHECATIAESLPEGKGYLARAKWKLGIIYVSEEDAIQAASNAKAAHDLRRELLGTETPDDDSEASFDKLVVWMLW